MAKRRGELDDDDLGLRTPTRKQPKPAEDAPAKRGTGKHERPAKRETGKRERPAKPETGKHERPAKRETGKHERPAKRETGKHERPAKPEAGEQRPAEPTPAGEAPPPPRARSQGVSTSTAAVAGVLAVLLVAGLGVALLRGGDEAPRTPPPVARRQTEALIVDETQSPARPLPAQAPAEPRPIEPARGALQEVRLEPPPPAEPKGDALEALAKRSATHAAVARVLEELARLLDPAALHNPGPLLSDFRERQQREEELIAQLRAMGPGAVDALKDMLLGLDNRQYRIFLGKALAGMDGPEALAAVRAVLGEVKDVALQTTLVRYLPETPDAAEAVAAAIGGEENGNLRSMLLREYHRRLAEGDDRGRDVFRHAALEDADPNVRAEAVTIIGRRGDPRDRELMEQIIANEQNLSIRQRAIVSYAETGKEDSLAFLEQMARDQETALAVRASAVLAIGRVGGQGGQATQQAIQSLDLIAQTDSSQEIRTRADRLSQSLRRRETERQNPSRVDNPPMRIDPPPIPIERQ